MMRPLGWTTLIGCLVLAAGCTHQPTTAANDRHSTDGARPDLAQNGGTGGTSSGSGVPAPTPNSIVKPGDKDKKTQKQPKTSDGANTGKGRPTISSTDVPPLPQSDWKPASLQPVAIAEKIDQMLGQIKNGQADIHLHMILPAGEGLMHTDAKIASANKFSVTFPVLDNDPPRTTRCRIIANHGKFTEFHPGHQPAFSPLHPYRLSGDADGEELAKRWPYEMPRLALSHFVNGKNAFAPLIKALQQPKSGFHVVSQERTTSMGGAMFTNYRIYASKLDPKSKKSLAEYEIVVDAHTFAPVTMRTHLTPPGKNATVIEWSSQWSDAMPKEADFRLPS